jgi:hypothetical protein
VVGITTLYLKGGENLIVAIPVNDVKLLLSTDSRVQDCPNDTHVDAPSTSVNVLPKKLVCVDGVVNTVETPFLQPGEFVTSSWSDFLFLLKTLNCSKETPLKTTRSSPQCKVNP